MDEYDWSLLRFEYCNLQMILFPPMIVEFCQSVCAECALWPPADEPIFVTQLVLLKKDLAVEAVQTRWPFTYVLTMKDTIDFL